ncbi:hypothetical protein LN042_11310 [Kitasatospora sp. RB6PN24]|uniref:hypothetical protein n=1 Tax=Kitasatospora humi TaxID=2893891 RepID=UPI001E4FF9CB|nr:hypothetical protein [Kitasatospora humi]MCC9307683.1 hypothetical protein [Kitasatospora humi]
MSDTAPYPQRNPGDSPVDVPAIPATVLPGETVLWPVPIAGFEPVPDAPSPAPAAADTTPTAPAKTTARARTASEE